MTLREFIKRNLRGLLLLCLTVLLILGLKVDVSEYFGLKKDDIPDREGVFYTAVGPNARLGSISEGISDDRTNSDEKANQASDGNDEKNKNTNVSSEIHLVMVGDMLMHDSVISSGKRENGYDYDGLFEHVRDYVRNTDLAIVNQETILGGTEMGLSGYPTFNSPVELGDSEVKAGFNIILHATNHAYDRGKTGILNTIRFWEDNYPEIPYLGINENQAHKDNYLCIYEKDQMRVAILNYTFGINGGSLPASESYLINFLDENKVVSDLKKIRGKVDFIIVCPHWGTEYQLAQNSYQEKWTKIFLENGVDLVLGAHPHVIQPICWVEGQEGRRMLVYYSLGNFVNGTTTNGSEVLQRIIGGMADVIITKDKKGEVRISDYGVRPLICHFDDQGHYTTYFLGKYRESLLEKNGYKQKIPGLSISKCWDYVNQVWGGLANE